MSLLNPFIDLGIQYPGQKGNAASPWRSCLYNWADLQRDAAIGTRVQGDTVRQPLRGLGRVKLFELSVPNGAETEFGPQAWPNFWRIYWLSDEFRCMDISWCRVTGFLMGAL